MSDERYTVISSDTHAGADLRDYKPYLPEKFHADFDAWADAYVSPWDDLVDKTAYLNWDSDARIKELEQDGIVGEVVFPNTIPPFFPTVGTIANAPRTADEYVQRWAGLQAHNRWLVDFCGQQPDRRRGLIQVLPNNVEDAVAEIHWAATHKGIGGVLIPSVPPNYPGIDPLFSTVYDPIWQACAETGLAVTNHSGTGLPDFPYTQIASGSVTLVEFTMWSHRTFSHLMLGGVFERFPDIKFVMTEQGGPQWFEAAVKRLDYWVDKMKDSSNRTYTMFAPDIAQRLPLKPSEYFDRNVFIGASFMQPQEVPYVDGVGAHKIMWGADYPHEEGTTPHTLKALRLTFADQTVEKNRQMLGGVAAQVYNFDLEKLDALAAVHGPKVSDVAVPLRCEDFPDSQSSAFDVDFPADFH